MRLIDADALSELLKNNEQVPTVEPTFGLFKEMLCAKCEKRPQGEWIRLGIINTCSICNCDVLLTITDKICNGSINFCPNCGADMRGDKK